MKPVFRSNLFALALISIYLIGGKFIIGPLHLHQYESIGLAEILFLLVPTIIYFVVTKLSVVDTLRLHKINIESVGIIILIAMVSYPIAAFGTLLPQIYFTDLTTKVLGQFSSLPLLTLLGIQAVTPAICEEVTMRGVILSGYKDVSIKKAAIMNGIIFGLFHMNPDQLVYAFTLGVIFTYIFYLTDSLFSTMIAHFVFNGGNTLYFWFATNIRGVKVNSNTNGGFKSLSLPTKIFSLCFTFILAVLAVMIVVLLLKQLKKVNEDKKAFQKFNNPSNQAMSENSEMKLLYNDTNSVKERVVNLPFIIMIIIYIGYIAFNISKYTS